MHARFSTGLPNLDASLGGGLLPGTLTMVIGATGVGKTQLAMAFREAGRKQEGQPGTIIDLSSRGDSQNHAGYGERMFGTPMTTANPARDELPDPFGSGRPEDVLPFLGYGGSRVLRSQMDVDQWHTWQSELNRRLPFLSHFVYGHLVHGTRRFIVDGIEPQSDRSDSLQLDLLESIYHRMLRKEHDWLAREVFRERYRDLSGDVMQYEFDHQHAAGMVLVTTTESMLDQLMMRPLADGDLAAGANTVILMGRVLQDGRMQRGLYIAKHRGSAADDRIIPFSIDDSGLVI
ncbi:MAG: ATPase domain-containing protein [Aureliella sp.]